MCPHLPWRRTAYRSRKLLIVLLKRCLQLHKYDKYSVDRTCPLCPINYQQKYSYSANSNVNYPPPCEEKRGTLLWSMMSIRRSDPLGFRLKFKKAWVRSYWVDNDLYWLQNLGVQCQTERKLVCQYEVRHINENALALISKS